MSSCTDERNAQILIQVLKAHGIKKVIASPGTTNACLVSSMQSDPFFEIYSAPGEIGCLHGMWNGGRKW